MSRATSQNLFRRCLVSPRIAARAALLCVCAAVVFVSSTHVRAADARVVVRLYDIGNVAVDVRTAAIGEAAAILKEAGVSIDWHDCTSTANQACRKSPDTWNLIVRVIPTLVPASGARSSVEARNRAVDADSELGVAIVDTAAHADAMATIFDDQVQIVARRTGVDRAELFGRALAHEVGHLLLRATGHSRAGLMRAVWTDEELTQNRREDWIFAEGDRRRLQLNSSRP
jgi:hypothetical protein